MESIMPIALAFVVFTPAAKAKTEVKERTSYNWMNNSMIKEQIQLGVDGKRAEDVESPLSVLNSNAWLLNKQATTFSKQGIKL